VRPDEELWNRGPLVCEEIFGRRAPLEIELGTGKARFLIEAARREPAHDFLGIERALSYYRFSRERLRRSGVHNAAVVRADAQLFVLGAVPAASVHGFHVYFPDPWPKKRQRKRRLLDAVFLEALAARLAPEGLLRIATDHPGYGDELAVLLQTVPDLEDVGWDALPPPPPTHYEIKYRAEGRSIRKFLFRRRPQGSGAGAAEISTSRPKNLAK
jgi:tRNA (guanine-N7-)-methyltransferase